MAGKIASATANFQQWCYVVSCDVETAANLKKQHGKTLKPSLDHFQQMQHDQPFASVCVSGAGVGECVCICASTDSAPKAA